MNKKTFSYIIMGCILLCVGLHFTPFFKQHKWTPSVIQWTLFAVWWLIFSKPEKLHKNTHRRACQDQLMVTLELVEKLKKQHIELVERGMYEQAESALRAIELGESMIETYKKRFYQH